MRNEMKNRFIFFILVFIFMISSCYKAKEISLEKINSLAITPDLEWAVIVVPYATFKERPDYASDVINYSRIGEIMLVEGKKKNKSLSSESNSTEYVMWYKFEKGWLDESLVKVFDTKYKAEKELKNLDL